jgi:long-chain acyl-CoA synthetase
MQSADILETLKKNQVNIMIGVPRLYELLYKGIRAKIQEKAIARLLFKILSSLNARGLAKKIFKKVHEGLGGHLEVMVAGGAALNPEVGKFFYALGFDVLEGYGMTEAAPMITFTRPGHIRIGYTGQALPGLRVETRDGEIVASGPNIMMGYYNRPEETAEVLKDGWLYTGDLGTIDKQGFLRITGRKKEIIVLANGKNISPVELETRLASMVAYIKDVAVFMHKEMLHALIVVDQDALDKAGITDARQYFREKGLPDFNKEISTYKRITQFTLSEVEIPRTKLGKIQRFLLPEFIEKTQPVKKKVPLPVGEEYRSIHAFLEQVCEKSVAPDDHLEYDVALDSLGRISVIDFIEKNFGVAIAETEFQKYPTLSQLAAYVSEHKKWQKNQEISWSEIIKEKVHLKLPTTWPTFMLMKNTALSFFSVYFRFSANGMKNLPDGPCIIAPNHQSFFDGLFVASFMKRKTMTKTYFFAKKKHVNTLLLNFMAKRNNIIVVDTSSGLKESIQKMADVLKSGKKIIVFPEGTRTHDGALGEFKRTFAILSKELEVPVVPVAIDGAFRALPRGAYFPRPFTRVRVSFMNPVYPEHYTVDGLTQKIWQVIQKKLG